MMRIDEYSLVSGVFDDSDRREMVIAAALRLLGTSLQRGSDDPQAREAFDILSLMQPGESSALSPLERSGGEEGDPGARVERRPYLGLRGERSMIFEMTQRHLTPRSFGEPVDSYQNAKVLIVGHWKSGTVWLHQLLCDVLQLPMLLPRLGKPEDFFTAGCVKTHELLSPYLRSRGDLLHGVYILRDIRDCIVSMYHFTKTEYYATVFGPAAASFADIDSFYYDFFLSWFVPQYDWENHPLQYI